MNIKHIVLLAGTLFITSCTSTGSFVVNSVAKIGDYTKHSDIAFNDYKKLDVYIPDINKSEPLPVVVFYYGGCWGACQSAFKKDYEFVADTLTQKGYVVVIPDYRYYPKHRFNTIIKDAAQAMEWTQNNISQYGGNKNKIYLMGHSAGAHLAMMLTVQKDYLKAKTHQAIKGVIGLAGPYDFIPYTEPYLPGVFGPAQTAAYSQPINFINGNEPPMLLMYGNKDQRVMPKNIINLTKKVKEKGGQVRAKYYPELNHLNIMTGFSRLLKNNQLVDEVDNFIQNHN